MRIATFTGPHTEVPQRAYNLVANVVQRLDVEMFVTGAAHYIDTMAAQSALAFHPDKKHRLVVPRGRHNEPLVYYFCILQKESQFDIEVELMPEGTGHVDRDNRMIQIAMEGEDGSGLHAFPMTQNEQMRSGTWTTVRHARKAGLPINFYPLNGSAEWYE